MFFSNKTPKEIIGKIIEDTCNSGVKNIDIRDLKEFKTICKNGDKDFIEFVYRIMKLQLIKNHSQKRYSCVLFYEVLFPRSHLFRLVFCEQKNFNEFLELTLGINKEKPLPKPKNFANLLKEKVYYLIKEWIKNFGKGYPTLEQIFNLNVPVFEEHRNTNNIQRERQIDHAEIRERILQENIKKQLNEFKEIEQEIYNTNESTKKIFDSIIPKNEFSLDENNSNTYEIDHEMARLLPRTNAEKQSISIVVKTNIDIYVNKDNENIIEELKENYQKLVNSHLPKTKTILKNLSKLTNKQEKEIKKLINYKNEILELISKFTELNFIHKIEETHEKKKIKNDSSEDSSTDDDDFEIVKEKDIEGEVPPEKWSDYGVINPFENEPSTSGCSYDPKACNFKLENGNLCPRKDKNKCPFHGKIIPRDYEGNIINPELRKKEEESLKRRNEDWQDPKYLKELEKELGIDLTIKPSKKPKKNPELLDLKKYEDNPKKRLMKKLRILKK